MKCLIQIVIGLILFGCGGYSTGTIQKVEKGFLKFSGNTSGITISIDDSTPFSEEADKEPKIELYEVTPGKHTVKIFRDNKLIVNRQIIINNETIFEIEVQ